MQLMCPSCCGGLFSETKGSVYMKRSASSRKSETKSITTTICSEIEEDETYSETPSKSSTRENKPRKINSLKGRLKTEPTIEEENYDENAKKSKLIEENVPDGTGDETVDQEPVFEHHINEDADKKKSFRRQKLAGETIEEEMDVRLKHGLLKNRSLSLGETIANALTEEISRQSNGEVYWQHKLRKTSVPQENTKGRRDMQEVELKIGGKECVKIKKQTDENETLFDFQAFLRKTNNNRQSLRRASDTPNVTKNNEDFVTELFPGAVLTGTVYDL